MDKYSLESYERVRMTKCRPAETAEASSGAAEHTFVTLRTEPGKTLPELRGKTLLDVRIPEENMEDLRETESALRMLAAGFCRHPLVIGVTLSAGGSGAVPQRLWEAAADAFSPKRFFVPVNDGVQLDYALKRGFLGGLLAVIGDSALDTCEAFALHNAQRLYRRFPVLVRLEGREKNAAQYAEQWHALAVENIPGARVGYRIALRRLTYPQELSSGGFAPMRFWWTNRGPGCCLAKTEVRLRLEKEGKYAPVPLNDHPDSIQLADRVYNEIVKLPQVVPGTYRLEYGLFSETGEPLPLCHEGGTADGYYFAGELVIDDRPRPELAHLWENWSADGYYPLFDPKVPGT